MFPLAEPKRKAPLHVRLAAAALVGIMIALVAMALEFPPEGAVLVAFLGGFMTSSLLP